MGSCSLTTGGFDVVIPGITFSEMDSSKAKWGHWIKSIKGKTGALWGLQQVDSLPGSSFE